MNDSTRRGGLAVRARVVPLPVPEPQRAHPEIAEEQLAYARVLERGMKLGFMVLVVTFAIYATGVVTPHVPVDELHRYWSLPVKRYLAVTGIPPGWGWLPLLGKSDFLNFAGVALLSSVAIVCYGAVSPIFFRKKDRIYGWLSLLEIAVLVLAASGLLKTGGH